MLENSLVESSHHIDETIKTENSKTKMAPKEAVHQNSMFLSNKPSRDMLMDDSAMLSI